MPSLPVVDDQRTPVGAGVEHDHHVARNRELAYLMERVAERLEGATHEPLLVVHRQHDPDRPRSLE
jgi:hypothetical protein